MSSDLPPCFYLDEPALLNLILGCISTVGTFIAFSPQIYKLHEKLSTQGLSLLTVFLYNVANASTIYNAIFSNWDRLVCCRELNFWRCSEIIVSMYILIAAWFCWKWIYIACLVFWEKSKNEQELEVSKRDKILAYSAFLFHLIVYECGGIATTLMINYLFPKGTTQNYSADLAFGVIGATAITLVWMPQIFTTIKHKDPGSLSVLMLCISAPGTYVSVYILIASGNAIWVWLPTLISAILQSVLAVICIYFHHGKKIRPWLSARLHPRKFDFLQEPELDLNSAESSYVDNYS